VNPYDKPGATQPLDADRRLKFIHLTPKQKRMLWFAFSGIAVVGAGIGVYIYISSAPERAQEQFQNAMKLMKPGNYELAINGFNQALNTWPRLSEAHFERGNAYHNLGRDDEAIADFEQAVDLDPGWSRALVAIGSIYSARHDYQRAMDAYSRSISAKPSIEAYYQRGQTYEALGEHQKAIEDFNRAIQEFPNSPVPYRARALARRNLGDQAGYETDRDEADRIERRH
jgi:tetratricopeptide (TPR) repeat protein